MPSRGTDPVISFSFSLEVQGILTGYFTEISGAPVLVVRALGFGLLLGRVARAYGVSQSEENLRFRVFGMAVTFSTLGVGAAFLLVRYGVTWAG